MKKTILFFGIVAGIFTANAQKSTANVTLNVDLKHSQSIAVNNSTVTLKYDTQTNYSEGVQSVEKDHLAVFSTGSYAIFVTVDEASNASLLNNGKTAVKISAVLGSTPSENNKLTFNAESEFPLSTEINKLGSSDKAGKGNITVTYKGAGEDIYLDKLGGKDNTLTTNVIYTIAAK